MQFSLRYDEGIWELTHHEKEVMVLAIHWEITVKFHTIPIDTMLFEASFTPNPDCSRETWNRLFFVRKNDEVELICRYGNLLLLLVDGTVHGNGYIATIFTELPQAVTNVYILFISLFGSNTHRR